ncbi:MAG: DUF2357 domain-containing protein [Oscillospiraceae bacterium]
MDKIILKLIPYKKQEQIITLQDIEKIKKDNFDKINNEIIFYENLSYDVSISSKNEIKDIVFFINGENIRSKFENNKLHFENKWIFNGQIGFSKIFLNVVYADGKEKTYSSEHHHIYITEEVTKSVSNMITFIYQNNQNLLYSKDNYAYSKYGLDTKNIKSMESYISLLKKIYDIYYTNYKYFHMNSKSKMEEINDVNSFEKLKKINSQTIQYIASHPEELSLTNSPHGIKFNKNTYLPLKTLVQTNKKSYNTYENRIVNSFLNVIIDTVISNKQLVEKRLLEVVLPQKVKEENYICSSQIIFQMIKEKLQYHLQELKLILNDFYKLKFLYEPIFNINKKLIINITSVPKSSLIFRAVKHYREVYNVIEQWFEYGQYDLKNEDFILSLLKSNSLYEHYLLIKFNKFLSSKSKNKQPLNVERLEYKMSSDKLYKNTLCQNKYEYDFGEQFVSLFFQPVIYTYQESERRNGIGLFKNTSFNIDFEKSSYYTPDYIIKIRNKTENVYKYLIMDAKFSDILNVKKYQLSPLCFKYLFSVTPLENNSSLVNLAIINANKSTKSPDEIFNLNNISIDEVTASQSIDLLTLTPTSDEEQHNKIIYQYLKQFLAFI